MKFLIDMNLTPRWARFLVEQGFQAIHWSSVGPGDASDHDVMR
jgi:predicted nuclease of predicted toxin-antitoxin system